jgi:hypothetical protein
MSKHTPAPWVLKIRPGMGEASQDATVAEIETAGKYRGGIAYMQSAEHIEGIGREELIANARLIAAAPAMLAALKLLLSSAHDYQSGITEAQEAIDNAEGRS